MDTELLKQLTRIADAMEKQNIFNLEWFAYNRKIRAEDIHRRERETNLARREQEYEHVDTLTREFIEKHPEIVHALMEHQIQTEQVQEESKD